MLAQSYTDWEHIITDGGSTDTTLDILRKYPHLQWSSAPDNGQSDAMNKAFGQSTGDFIIYLNADDELKPEALQHFADGLKSHPEADMVVADLEVNHSGAVSINVPSVNLRQVLNYWPCIFPANPVSYAYKRKLQDNIGKFPVHNHYTMDYWFLLRAFLKGKVVKEGFIAGTFHFDGTNKSADPANSQNWLKQVRDQFLYRYFYYPEVAKFWIRLKKGFMFRLK